MPVLKILVIMGFFISLGQKSLFADHGRDWLSLQSPVGTEHGALTGTAAFEFSDGGHGHGHHEGDSFSISPAVEMGLAHGLSGAVTSEFVWPEGESGEWETLGAEGRVWTRVDSEATVGLLARLNLGVSDSAEDEMTVLGSLGWNRDPLSAVLNVGVGKVLESGTDPSLLYGAGLSRPLNDLVAGVIELQGEAADNEDVAFLLLGGRFSFPNEALALVGAGPGLTSDAADWKVIFSIQKDWGGHGHR